MAWLPMYLTAQDLEILNVWLNQEEEIAFLVSNGDKKWVAKRQHSILENMRSPDSGSSIYKNPNYIEFHLWHIPSGPLPLIQPHKGLVTPRVKQEDWEIEKSVNDPWLGWTELVTGANNRVPYFRNHPGIIHFEIHLPSQGAIPMSAFGWIGNHYSIIGSSAAQTTELFWKRLKRMAKKVATHIPRGNLPDTKKEIYAFPNAYKEILNGRPCSINL